jgi:hypothetical protein
MPDLPETVQEVEASQNDGIVPVLIGAFDLFEARIDQKS